MQPDDTNPPRDSSPAGGEFNSRSAAAFGRNPAVSSLWLLAGLVLILLPAWAAQGISYQVDIWGGLANPWLPAAMALLLSVRAGGLDLSVWGGASLGSVLAWWALDRGSTVPAALGLALAGGAAAGLVQAAVVRWVRVPSYIVTAVGGVALLALARRLAAVARLDALDPQALGAFGNVYLRHVLAIGLYLLAMLAVMSGERGSRDGRGPALSRSAQLFAALWGGGALAAGAGAVILLGQSAYVSRAYLISDFRAPAAVALCGAWVWRGRRGTVTSGLLLPPAMLAATMWRELVAPPWNAWAYQFPLCMLTVMVLGRQAVDWGQGRCGWRRMAARLTFGGAILAAAGGYWVSSPAAVVWVSVGSALWVAGLTVGLARLAACRRAAATTPHGLLGQ